jgi:hypothetical protein
MYEPGHGQNPVIADIGMSDPHIRVFNDTIFLYCGHDSGPGDPTWIMRDWRIFSTTNLVDWTFEQTISPKDNYMDDNSTDCWAGDAAMRNGPYECAGAVGEGHHLSEYAHGSFFWWKGQFYHIWCYYLRQGYKYRESIITYCHFDDDGAIVTDTDFLDKHFSNGVGQYHASWPEIQAEWYYEISTEIHKKGNRKDGFVLTGIRDGSWARYANVHFDRRCGTFEAAVSISGGKGQIEIRAGSPEGKLLGAVRVLSAEDPGSLQVVSCEMEGGKGRKDIVLRFNGDETSTFELDWYRFQN